MQPHCSKYFARTHSPTALASNVNIQLFLEHGHVSYRIKENHRIFQHGSKYFARRPNGGWAKGQNSSDSPPNPRGIKVKIQLFSEHGHVAYQIK